MLTCSLVRRGEIPCRRQWCKLGSTEPCDHHWHGGRLVPPPQGTIWLKSSSRPRPNASKEVCRCSVLNVYYSLCVIQNSKPPSKVLSRNLLLAKPRQPRRLLPRRRRRPRPPPRRYSRARRKRRRQGKPQVQQRGALPKRCIIVPGGQKYCPSGCDTRASSHTGATWMRMARCSWGRCLWRLKVPRGRV